MKKVMTLMVIVLQATLSFAQLKFEKSYDVALKNATILKRPVMVYILPPNWPPVPPSGKPFIYGLDQPEVIDFYNKNFVMYKTTVGDSIAGLFSRKYQLTRFPAFIFEDNKGYLLTKSTSGAPIAQPYLSMANEAIAKLKSGKTIGSYEAQYQSGKLSAEFLKTYIDYRISMGINDNAKLIDQYVDFLKIGDFSSYQEVLYVLKAGPYVYGKAYNLAYTNKKLVDSIYKRETMPSLTAMNNLMRENTMNEAIRTKSPVMARNVANFISATHQKNPNEGYKQSTYAQILYAKEVKDTAMYIGQATYYYDRYFMTISADSAKRLEKKIVEQRNKIITAEYQKNLLPAQKDQPYIKRTLVIGKVVSGDSTINNISSTLNNAAWDVYVLKIRNTNSLLKALSWSKRAVELSPVSSFYDTLAHIMERLGFNDEALLNENKAIKLAIKENRSQDTIGKLKASAEMMNRQISN